MNKVVVAWAKYALHKNAKEYMKVVRNSTREELIDALSYLSGYFSPRNKTEIHSFKSLVREYKHILKK